MVCFIEYGGANGNKLSIIINDELWMLKFILESKDVGGRKRLMQMIEFRNG